MKLTGLNDVGEALRRRRIDLGLSQDALAQKAGVTQTQISGIERGGSNARIGTVMAVARTLGLEMAFIPKEIAPAVQSLLAGEQEAGAERPLYALEDED